MKLSVIITVYQSQATLVRCISSVEMALKKLYNRYVVDNELIIVNDGSSDDSYAICRVLEKKYSNIRLFHEKHVGRLESRNLALSFAEGDFICFVNPEDIVEERYFLNLFSHMKADTSLVSSIPQQYGEDDKKRRFIHAKNDLYTVIETTWDAIDEYLVEYDHNTVLGMMFRNSYITNKFLADKEPYSERCFIVDYLCQAKGVVKITSDKEYIIKNDFKDTVSYETLNGIKRTYLYISQRMDERGCRKKEAVFLKFVDEYMRCFHRLSYEEQNSPTGKELIKKFVIEEKNLAKDMNLSLLESIYHFGKTINLGAVSGSIN